MVEGVTKGYEKKLKIVGVGWNAKTQGQTIVLNIGFCHSVPLDAPADVKFEIENNTLITLSTPLDLSSSNLPIKGIFIPFVLEITKENSLKNHYTCNETINSEEDIAYTTYKRYNPNK